MSFDVIMENGLSQITEEFILENKNHLQKINSQKKKGGPYSKLQRSKRREEVYRLHFEYGYTARKISELMNIHRNTINGDVQFWYDRVIENWNGCTTEVWVVKNIERLELQRTRVVEQLNKTKVLREKTSLERMILDIESKILQTQLKLSSSRENSHILATNWLNDWMKKNGLPDRYISYGDIKRVPGKSYEKICSLIKNG